MQFKYVGPLDAVDVPDVNAVDVKRGKTITATGDLAEKFKQQPDVWEPVPSKTKEK